MDSLEEMTAVGMPVRSDHSWMASVSPPTVTVLAVRFDRTGRDTASSGVQPSLMRLPMSVAGTPFSRSHSPGVSVRPKAVTTTDAAAGRTGTSTASEASHPCSRRQTSVSTLTSSPRLKPGDSLRRPDSKGTSGLGRGG